MQNIFKYYLDASKSGVLVENKALIPSEEVELHLYETTTQCKGVEMKFSLPILAFMMKGDKLIDMEGVGKFKYTPGSSLIIPKNTNLVIDFPTASADNPAQCLAFVPGENLIEEAKFDYYKQTASNFNVQERVNLDQGAHLHDIGIMRTIENLLFLFSENNEHRDYFINLSTKELIIRILQSKARHSFLHYFDNNENAMSNVARHIRDKIHQPLNVDDLATIAGMSRTKFYHQFKQIFGLSPNRYVIEQKIERAKQLLIHQKNSSITEISYKLSYADSAYFTKQFKEITGMSPSSFVKFHNQKTNH